MKRKILLFCSLLLAITCLLFPTQAQDQIKQCDVARSVCMGGGDLLFQICTVDHSTSYCLNEFIIYYNNCMASNGCS